MRDVRLGCGVVGRFPEEEREGLLSVLHLWSDRPSSPGDTPYKCQARPLIGCLRHPGDGCAHAGRGP